MKKTVKQFVTQEACLKCRGCCRFRQENSVWSPCLLEEEIQDLLDKNYPSVFLGVDKRIKPVVAQGQDGFVCPFLDEGANKCKIYDSRPFECQLYPFLICFRNKKVLLTVDLNCPYIQEHIQGPEFKEYLEYLTAFLNSPKQLRLLSNNPHMLSAYEEVLDLIELDLSKHHEV